MSQENMVNPPEIESPSSGAGKGISVGVWIGIGLIVVCVLAVCAIAAIMCLLGPVVGNVFSNIVENLEMTPVP
jgi:hypothetical protein